jgi:hypothetical protein
VNLTFQHPTKAPLTSYTIDSGDSPVFGIPDSFVFNGLLFFLKKGRKIGARLLSRHVSLKKTLLRKIPSYPAPYSPYVFAG